MKSFPRPHILLQRAHMSTTAVALILLIAAVVDRKSVV